MIFKFQSHLHRKKHKPLSDQFLIHFNDSLTPSSSYAVLQNMYQLSFDSQHEFLDVHGVKDDGHFVEHCSLLSSWIKLKRLIMNQLVSLMYPSIMVLMSVVMFYSFRYQFSTLFSQLEISFPSHHRFIILIHALLVLVVLMCLMAFFWIKSAYFLLILYVQQFRKTRWGHHLFEWAFMNVVCSLQESHLTFDQLSSIMRAHTKNPIMSILSYELKEHSEHGKTMFEWISYVCTPSMSHWIVEQLSIGNIKQLHSWNEQVFHKIKYDVMSLKNVCMIVLYAVIGLNIIGMLDLLATPYEWIKL